MGLFRKDGGDISVAQFEALDDKRRRSRLDRAVDNMTRVDGKLERSPNERCKECERRESFCKCKD